MSNRRVFPLACGLLGIWVFVPLLVSGPRAAADTLPARLDDKDFWQIAQGFSVRPGTFGSDNLLSNEGALQEVIPDLVRAVKPHGVYLGVGPEQNFTYIAALKPRMAFIVDIRRGNFTTHLMYKALFELSADRAELVSRLFSKKRPDGLGAASTVAEIFDAYLEVQSSDALYSQNMRAIVNHLVKTHGFQLGADDMLRLQHVYRAFYAYGPAIQYSSTQTAGRRRTNEPSYRDLMLATDRGGQPRSYLSSEQTFQFLKNLESQNLIVPVIGNFAGTKAIRAIGDYLKTKGVPVSVFYVSNVEEYLRQDGLWPDFCANVAALPIDEASVFIRSVRGGDASPPTVFGLHSELESMSVRMSSCALN
jgi:hypothetical protein